MGRKNKYESHVKPYLAAIPKWYETMTEGQIAKKLGVSSTAWENYKIQNPELVECLRQGKEILVDELKDTLRTKAKGFHYTETKETYIEVEKEDGSREKVGEIKVEKTENYAVPDTGAIHLLLKNLDEQWRNDDKATMDLKREKLELYKQKAESESW